jgi:Lar family restriction alleviation protein
MNCTHCGKRLSRKSARLIDGVVMCSKCMFTPAKQRKTLARIEARSGETACGLDPKDESRNSSEYLSNTSGTQGMTNTNNPSDQAVEAVALLPCPFCGGEASADGHIRFSRPLNDAWWPGNVPISEAFYVNCVKCGAVSRSGIVGGYQTRDEAIERWNTRAIPTPPADTDLIARLREYAEHNFSQTQSPQGFRLIHEAADAIEAADALQAHASPRELEPLDWKWNGLSWTAETPWGNYNVRDNGGDGLGRWAIWISEGSVPFNPMLTEDADAAKAAVEAHYAAAMSRTALEQGL